jgi:ribosomal protein L11 methyltransferase
MCLRFLEQLTRRWPPGWTLADLGTGSGILTLAAKRFGAGHVISIDNDPAAISVAKSNARSNHIRGADFQVGDVREWKSTRNIDVITANLYSDLLVEMLPKLRGGARLILSGILRSQQYEFVGALQRNLFEILTIKNRGKWIAILARSDRFACTGPAGGKFLRRPQTAATVKINAN